MKSILCAALLFVPIALACGAEREAGPAAEPAPEAEAVAQLEPVAEAPAETAEAPADTAAAADASADAPAPSPDAPIAPPTDFWLFREFDWGDSEEVVYESVEYTDGFLCYRHKLREHCAFVKTRVDGEELLARFYFVDDRLYRADILTPDLDGQQAGQHLERVWKLLAAYVTRLQGEAPEQAAFPDYAALTPGQIRVTHRWKQPEQEIRIVIERNQGALPRWITAVRVVESKWAGHEPKF